MGDRPPLARMRTGHPSLEQNALHERPGGDAWGVPARVCMLCIRRPAYLACRRPARGREGERAITVDRAEGKNAGQARGRQGKRCSAHKGLLHNRREGGIGPGRTESRERVDALAPRNACRICIHGIPLLPPNDRNTRRSTNAKQGQVGGRCEMGVRICLSFLPALLSGSSVQPLPGGVRDQSRASEGPARNGPSISILYEINIDMILRIYRIYRRMSRHFMHKIAPLWPVSRVFWYGSGSMSSVSRTLEREVFC